MSSRIQKVSVVLFFFGLLSSVFGHSQMRCAKYNKATGTCSAPIRNQGQAFGQESYPFSNGAAICQAPMMNPISASYSNGPGCPSWAPCPDPMGTFAPGEQFTVMWLARNHAIDNQSPGLVTLFLSPPETVNQGADVSQAAMMANPICQGPYKNCGGENSDLTRCTLDCTMPTNTAAGIYTLWWKWDWHDGSNMYTTCADIVVSGSSSSNPTPPTPVPTPTPTPSTPATTSSSNSCTDSYTDTFNSCNNFVLNFWKSRYTNKSDNWSRSSNNWRSSNSITSSTNSNTASSCTFWTMHSWTTTM